MVARCLECGRKAYKVKSFKSIYCGNCGSRKFERVLYLLGNLMCSNSGKRIYEHTEDDRLVLVKGKPYVGYMVGDTIKFNTPDKKEYSGIVTRIREDLKIVFLLGYNGFTTLNFASNTLNSRHTKIVLVEKTIYFPGE
jgi:hypothetical protein